MTAAPASSQALPQPASDDVLTALEATFHLPSVVPIRPVDSYAPERETMSRDTSPSLAEHVAFGLFMCLAVGSIALLVLALFG